jgi:drug/metabolite transporter (DMT)-like permease
MHHQPTNLGSIHCASDGVPKLRAVHEVHGSFPERLVRDVAVGALGVAGLRRPHAARVCYAPRGQATRDAIVPTVPDGARSRAGPAPATLTALVVAVVLAGGNAPAIRYVSCGTCELDPFWGAAIRFLLAALIFAGIAVALRTPLPRRKALLGVLLFGALQFGAGFGLVYWGLVRAPAGLAQVLLACVPLLTFGLALLHRQERFRPESLIGAFVAVGGIAVVFSNALHAGVPLGSMAAILGGAACWAEALVVVKAFPAIHPAVMNAIAMGVGGVVLVALGAVFGESFTLPQAARTWFAQAYLVLAGSIVVFWLYVFVVRSWTASAASYQLVLIPLVTVVVSAWLQDERISVSFVLGGILVLVGVYIGALMHPQVGPPSDSAAPLQPATAKGQDRIASVPGDPSTRSEGTVS